MCVGVCIKASIRKKKKRKIKLTKVQFYLFMILSLVFFYKNAYPIRVFPFEELIFRIVTDFN